MECWKSNLEDILWVRNQLVAPISEEFTFRACMVPQLLHCYSASRVVLVSPLFFGVGHFHHMTERCRQGMPFINSLLVSCMLINYHLFEVIFIFNQFYALIIQVSSSCTLPFLVCTPCSCFFVPDISLVELNLEFI